MEIVESNNIDLISPFPLTEAKRVFGWLHAYRTIVEHDQSPTNPEELAELLGTMIPNVVSYGVIDKNNSLEMPHPAPLIGMIAFEQRSVWNGYFHVASTRKAWGSGLIEEGGKAAISDIFSRFPNLTRVSAEILKHNYPAQSLAKRLGFLKEGVMEDMVTQKGEPKPLVHFGLTRKRWMENNQ
jgi:RimJ/RimL family protein N-acetyltransferase